MHESQSTDLIVARLENARQSLAFIETPSELKKLSDLAESAEAYARRQKLGDEVIGYAHRIKTLALRKLGEVLKAAPKAKGCQHGGRKRIDGSRAEPSNSAPTLADLGIDNLYAQMALESICACQEYEYTRSGLSGALAAMFCVWMEAGRITRR